MELRAVIEGLKALTEPCKVEIYSDSKYVVDAFNKSWIDGWMKKDWKNSQKKPVKNKDLWQDLIESLKDHQVTWNWVKGHSGDHYNERADQLATGAIDKFV